MDILNIGMGIAGTGSGAAASGSVAVNKIDNDTRAKVTGGAKVTAEKNAVVTAASDDRIRNYSGQVTASGTGAAAGLSVSTNIIGSHTDAEISGRGTEVISHAKNTDAATTVKDGLDHGKLYNAPLTLGTLTGLDGLSAGRKENTYRGVAVSASATHTANSFLVNGGVAGTGAAVNGTVNTNVIGGTTSARLTDATAKAAGADVAVRADDATNSGALVGTVSVAGEGAAIGTGSSINLVNRTTQAAAERSTITAKKITVTAENDLDFDEQSGAYGGGAVGASVGIAVNNFKSTVESMVTGSTLHAHEAADITAHDAKTIRQLATNGAAGIAAVGLNIMVMNVGADLKDSYTMEEGSDKKKQRADLQQHTDKEKAQERDAAARSQKGLSYVSSDDSGNMLAEKTAPSTAAKASARAEQSNIRADGNSSAINLSARDTMNITQLTMQAGIGGIAVGGAAGIVENRANAEVVTSGSKLRADTITLDSAKDGAAVLKIYQGAAGAGAFNAAYGGLNMGGRNDLAISGTEMHGKTITGTTRDATTGKVEIIGVAAATGNGANILVGNAAHDGVQTMRVANSTLTADGDLTLSMTRAASLREVCLLRLQTTAQSRMCSTVIQLLTAQAAAVSSIMPRSPRTLRR